MRTIPDLHRSSCILKEAAAPRDTRHLLRSRLLRLPPRSSRAKRRICFPPLATPTLHSLALSDAEIHKSGLGEVWSYVTRDIGGEHYRSHPFSNLA